MTRFQIDEKMDRSLQDLQDHFGASSKADVIKRAIALLQIATESEAEDGSITIRAGGVDRIIKLK